MVEGRKNLDMNRAEVVSYTQPAPWRYDLTDPEHLIAYCARVSNPSNQTNGEYSKLLDYLIDNKHWSPFEMVDVTLEITTTRDVSRQLLRHRSFSFQEFSQRYAEVPDDPVFSPVRMQHPTNRQLSTPLPEDSDEEYIWSQEQAIVWNNAMYAYKKAIKMGVAKEVARKLIPEGMTTTKLLMKGSVRSWIHYLEVRMGNGTQFDHMDLAKKCLVELSAVLPNIFPEEETEEHE